MEKISAGSLYFIFIISLFFACGTDRSNHETSAIKKDTLKKPVVIDSVQVKPKVRPINRKLDDIARYIAGLKIDTGSKLDPVLLNHKEWKNYSAGMDKNWERVSNSKISKMNPWTEKELNNLHTKTLFYPFAGADILNAHILFPHATKYILVGLEPVGTTPDLMEMYKTDSIQLYFNTINRSLSSILNFSFFRTKSMAVDFHKEDVNGTIHILLFFIARTGNSIIDIKPVAVNSAGELVSYSSFSKANTDSLKNRGVQIDFSGTDSIEHSVMYFSVNLGNDPFIKNQGFKTFLKKQGADVTYLKSASYLMHKGFFSEIRSTILNNSRAILQDDSGIPWKFFNDSTRTITLYGTYTGTIPLFSTAHQADLVDTYKKDSLKVKPLPFGIGYKYKEGQSNLMLSVKPASDSLQSVKKPQ